MVPGMHICEFSQSRNLTQDSCVCYLRQDTGWVHAMDSEWEELRVTERERYVDFG